MNSLPVRCGLAFAALLAVVGGAYHAGYSRAALEGEAEKTRIVGEWHKQAAASAQAYIARVKEVQAVPACAGMTFLKRESDELSGFGCPRHCGEGRRFGNGLEPCAGAAPFCRKRQPCAGPENALEANAAPRGEAKSTMVTQLFSLWCIITGQKHYIVIVMDSIDQAYPMLEAIKAELEFNPRLKTDFPEACGQGRVWQSGTAVTANDVKIQVAGSGKKLRGLRHGPYRPDLVVLDDIENDEAVRNPDMRDKLEGWLKKTVLHLGGVGQKFDVVYIGTILHYDSVLNRTLNNPMWHSARFKAMLKWPDNMAFPLQGRHNNYIFPVFPLSA